MLFFRQVWTLIVKNLLIALVRRPLSTPFRAFILPCVLIAFLSYSRNLFIPPSVYGIGEPTAVRSLADAVGLASGGREKLLFVNNGYTGGAIDRVIEQVSAPIQGLVESIQVLSSEEELLSICRQSLRGNSQCIAAAVFFSSPDEGPGGIWNYTIRADGGLESKIVTTSTTNDVEIYVLPLQKAIDSTIARLNSTIDQSAIPSEVLEYSYTSLTAEQRRERIRVRFMGGVIEILSIAFFLGQVGISYQLTGMIATEREHGMAQLLDCMMPNSKRWQPQMARIFSNHLSFDLIYAPSWIIMAIVLSIGVFAKTSVAILILFQVLNGMAMSSLSVFGASFFHRAQLSGIISVIVYILLGIVAQIAYKAGTASVAILSLIFPPMTYVYHTIIVARWERQDIGTNLVKAAPDNPSSLPAIALWVFTIVQIIVFPILGAYVENFLYGTGSRSRKVSTASDSKTAVLLAGFSKQYRPRGIPAIVKAIFHRKRDLVRAVDNLTFEIGTGRITVLLGANGSGKSTTLDSIAGLIQPTSGEIQVNYPSGRGALGFCPQKNVLWADLTVLETVQIFSRIKSVGPQESNAELHLLLASCDIDQKAKEKAKSLSGGQKRKLQLAIALAADSSICLIDEASSGLDPLSRRKIWDILLKERGSRAICLCTHYLDEADLLSDNIVILSKGSLRAEGTAAELKHRLGSGYRVHVYHAPGTQHELQYPGIPCEQRPDQTTYTLTDSAQASEFVAKLEADGVQEYQVNGPTIEEIFVKLAEEIKEENPEVKSGDSPDEDQDKSGVRVVTERFEKHQPVLVTGKRISMPKQAWVLFRKRFTVLRRNFLPHIAALLIPIVAAGLVTLFLKNFQRAGCSPTSSISVSEIASLESQVSYDLVAGPSSRLSLSAIERFAQSLPGAGGSESGSANLTGLIASLHLVDTLDEFNSYIDTRFANVTPGGFFLGDSSSTPTFAWQGDADISFPLIILNALDSIATNISIGTQYQAFDQPWGASIGSALQLTTYFGLAMSVAPSFFGLYPTIERLRNVRSLHYSNGVRSLPLWSAYVFFDFIFVLISSTVVTIIFATVSDVWYHVEYLFPVFLLYGIASILLSYIISFFARSQLASFAFVSAFQAVMFLGNFISFMSLLTYAPIPSIDRDVNISYFTIGLISPIANLTRAMFVALNIFSTTCQGRALAPDPGAMTIYGGPIVYLLLQSIFLFVVVLWLDSGPTLKTLRTKLRSSDAEDKQTTEEEVSNELTRVASSEDGLRVMNISKQFKKTLAVDNISFGVPRGEVFALLGVNGAGKSTTISLIRGDIQPSRKGGEILVETVSVFAHRAKARSSLGVTPQFDAMDTLTVKEHLDFYARIRGVSDPKHNVQEVIRAVGLQAYTDRMGGKLSGGNKRKLSLGIALIGNPKVLLLDEPSSGMDAAAKRVMWRTLESIVPGRSILLTSHSMEECQALASRVGIMDGRMLALGTTDYLTRKHGNAYYVQIIHRDSPHSGDDEMKRIRDWILEHFPDADVEEKTYHGQMRFSIPQNSTVKAGEEKGADSEKKGVSALFTLLESNKSDLGIEYYTISHATLDQVFLNVVQAHNVLEEGERGKAAATEPRRRKFWKSPKLNFKRQTNTATENKNETNEVRTAII